MEEKKKINRCKFALYRFNDGYNCVQTGWEDDKIRPTDEEKCEACQLFDSKYIEYPLTINDIDTKTIRYEGWPEKVGQLVAVRPCGDEYGNKTYVGFYLGDLPKMIIHSFNEKTGILKACTMDNPAIFVPELRKIIWGCESWWHAIRSEEELRKITDEDINNVWYVKLAKVLFTKEKREG